MSETQTIPEVEQALQELATQLVTPVIPGEMPEWLENARKAFDRAGTLLRRDVQSVHHTEYEQILEEDRGLAHRVEAMQKGDEDSLAKFAALGHVQAPARQLTSQAGRAAWPRH
jgi:hypothetical protein